MLAALGRSGDRSSDFDLEPDIRLPEHRNLRDAATLIPVLMVGAAPRLLLTKRSSALRHHPGQIAFPGGKAEAGDSTPEDTALREAQEEIGLPPSAVEVLGRLRQHETVTGFLITPVLGVVRDDFVPTPEPNEVAEVFEVPLAHVLDARNYAVQSRCWRGKQRRYYTVPYGPYYIWGATARILRGVAQ